jgi:hypothetical protein
MYSPRVVDKIVESLELGLPLRYACLANGVRPDTFLGWQERRPELEQTVAEAKARFVQAHLHNIKNHARGQWTASAWILERCQSEEFAKPEVKIQMLQVNAAAEKESHNAIWLQPPSLPGQSFPDIEFDDLQPKQLPAPEPSSPMLEVKKLDASQPVEVQPEVMEPAMAYLERQIHAHQTQLGPHGERLRQMQAGSEAPFTGQAVRPTNPPATPGAGSWDDGSGGIPML